MITITYTLPKSSYLKLGLYYIEFFKKKVLKRRANNVLFGNKLSGFSMGKSSGSLFETRNAETTESGKKRRT